MKHMQKTCLLTMILFNSIITATEKIFAEISYGELISTLMEELKTVNETLWDIEDFIRLKERVQDFGDEFIQLARNVYITNDQRFAIKRKIDALMGSAISEEKSYKPYT